MANLGAFDASQVAERNDFSPVAPGEYEAAIVDSKMKDTKDGSGKYLQLELEIVTGEYQGRKLFDRLNLVNKNTTASDIAYRTLGEICRACGKEKISDSEQLHGVIMKVTVKVTPPKDGYSESNVVTKYKPLTEVSASSSLQQKPHTAANSTQTPPWKRK